MPFYTITGRVTHHTTDEYCGSLDKDYIVPPFLVEAADENDARSLGERIVCPMRHALQYEGVTTRLELVHTVVRVSVNPSYQVVRSTVG